MTKEIGAISETVQRILKELPEGVILVAAAKTRTLDEVEAVVAAGIKDIGYNYIQEALPIINVIGTRAHWHMIGHLQTNKAKYVAGLFDMCQTIDSWSLAKYLEHRCEMENRELPVLIEINSGEESNKTGVLPENAEVLAKKIADLHHLHLQGLMTMGPRYGDPEKSRPYFNLTLKIFEQIKEKGLPGIEMKYLSMGMSNSYKIAIEEGANIVRIGTKLFGSREG